MVDVRFHVLAEHVLREEDDVVEALLTCAADETFRNGVHVWGADACLDELLAEHVARLASELAVVVENPVPALRQWFPIAGYSAKSVGAPRIGGIDGDAEKVDLARIVFYGEEHERVDDLTDEADGNLDEVGTDQMRCMAVPELCPSRPPATVAAGRPAMAGQNFTNGAL